MLLATKNESVVDEEIEREILLTTLDLHVQQMLDNLASWSMEETMLKEILETQKKSGDKSFLENRVEPKPTPRDGPLLSKTGKPLRPFVITTRENLQKQVFQPGHNLPTMTIDEYLDREMERGNFLSGGT